MSELYCIDQYDQRESRHKTIHKYVNSLTWQDVSYRKKKSWASNVHVEIGKIKVMKNWKNKAVPLKKKSYRFRQPYQMWLCITIRSVCPCHVFKIRRNSWYKVIRMSWKRHPASSGAPAQQWPHLLVVYPAFFFSSVIILYLFQLRIRWPSDDWHVSVAPKLRLRHNSASSNRKNGRQVRRRNDADSNSPASLWRRRRKWESATSWKRNWKPPRKEAEHRTASRSTEEE